MKLNNLLRTVLKCSLPRSMLLASVPSALRAWPCWMTRQQALCLIMPKTPEAKDEIQRCATNWHSATLEIPCWPSPKLAKATPVNACRFLATVISLYLARKSSFASRLPQKSAMMRHAKLTARRQSDGGVGRSSQVGATFLRLVRCCSENAEICGGGG